MNGVVAAQAVLFCEFSGAFGESLIDADDKQLALQRLEVGARMSVPGGGQASVAPCRRQRSAALDVGKNA